MKKLLDWYDQEGRDLPWRKTTDPYLITVSEFMLQQTQVPRVIPKFLAWHERFPDWKTLANASRQEVLSYWSGLGYNSRAARLHTLAKLVVDSGFPQSEEELQKLPGIGPYTAGAIRAFAYDEPGNFLDVNVKRILARYYFTKKQKPNLKLLEEKLLVLQKRYSPRKLANALMDLGSICSTKPACAECPLFTDCKTRGKRPEETTTKQATFKNSNRWWRGKILKALTQGARKKEELLTIDSYHKKAILAALEQLKKEELIEGTTTIRIKDA